MTDENRTALPLRTIASIVDADGTSGWKAEECLRFVSDLPPEDLAIPMLLSMAHTYALLEISSNIGTSGSGANLVQSIRDAGGIQ